MVMTQTVCLRTALLKALLASSAAYQLHAPPALAPDAARRVASPPRCAAASSFADIGIRGELCEALSEVGITEPNALQTRVIPALSGRADMVVGARTGSGKTLAYLLPVMQSLRSDEDRDGGRARPRRPRALVLLPTRELALQVREVARTLCRPLRVSVAAVHGGVPDGSQRRMLEQPVDVLVATPGRLLQHLERGHVFLGDVRHVVIDEVDTMFDAGFGAELEKLLQITTRDLSEDPRAAAAAADGARVQHIAVGATHPQAARALYARRLQSAKQLMLDDMHTAPPTLRQEFITCTGADGKVRALQELLGGADEEGRPRLGRVCLFCNSQDSARFVDHTLKEEGYATANYHGAVPANTRATNFDGFVAGESHVLVATDLAARGLDALDVSHVVQFDFPKSAAEYLHRAGRTARAGKRGTCHSLVTKFDTELVRAIQAANKGGGDVVTAGEAVAKKNAAPRLTLSRKGGAAAFPDSYGIGSKERRGSPDSGGGSGGKEEPALPATGRGKGRPALGRRSPSDRSPQGGRPRAGGGRGGRGGEGGRRAAGSSRAAAVRR